MKLVVLKQDDKFSRGTVGGKVMPYSGEYDDGPELQRFFDNLPVRWIRCPDSGLWAAEFVIDGAEIQVQPGDTVQRYKYKDRIEFKISRGRAGSGTTTEGDGMRGKKYKAKQEGAAPEACQDGQEAVPGAGEETQSTTTTRPRTSLVEGLRLASLNEGNLLEEVDDEFGDLQEMFVRWLRRYGDKVAKAKASISLTLVLEYDADDPGNVMIVPKIAVKKPTRPTSVCRGKYDLTHAKLLAQPSGATKDSPDQGKLFGAR